MWSGCYLPPLFVKCPWHINDTVTHVSITLRVSPQPMNMSQYLQSEVSAFCKHAAALLMLTAVIATPAC